MMSFGKKSPKRLTKVNDMSTEIMDAFKKVVDKEILNAAYAPLASYIEDNFTRIDLTYNSNIVENVDQATLLDFEFIRVDDINQDDDILIFQVVVSAEIEIEETIRRDREVDCVHKWFVLTCSAEVDDISNSFTVKSIRVY